MLWVLKRTILFGDKLGLFDMASNLNELTYYLFYHLKMFYVTNFRGNINKDIILESKLN